jgi:hypothetical protein
MGGTKLKGCGTVKEMVMANKVRTLHITDSQELSGERKIEKIDAITVTCLDGSDYQDMEFGVFLLNSSQHTLNVSIPSINNVPMLQVSLRLLSDNFSCAAVEPSTASIHILDGGDVDEDEG